MANYSVVSSSLGASYTGSIVKMLSLGHSNAVNTNLLEGSTLSNVEWGNHTEPDSAFTPQSVTADIKVPAGTYLEGPIGRVKTGTSGSWLIYTKA